MNRKVIRSLCGALALLVTGLSFPIHTLTYENAFSVAPAIALAASPTANSSDVAEMAATIGDLPSKDNPTMMQYFEWYLPNDGELWNKLNRDAKHLADVGIDSVWIPPSYKGGGSEDVGYGVYDVYDLGEFDQKGSVRTKYGFKDQLKSAITELHKNNVSVYADVVINHKGNQDGSETVRAVEVDPRNRNRETSGEYDIQAYTKFEFWGRGDKYSSFKWHANHFTGNDPGGRIFRFVGPGKGWNTEVDTENGSYDFLMFADIDYNNPEVVTEMKKWGAWFTNELDLDGFRLDAVKHIKFDFMRDFISNTRKQTGKNIFAVGEYWSGNVQLLANYIKKTQGVASLFDVPLHYRFNDVSKGNGNYDMREILKDTLSGTQPEYAVTFVDNHDTQPGQALQSFVGQNFKQQAYGFILTRQEGIPLVFYGDYYGNNGHGMQSYQEKIDKLLKARKLYAYGKQTDYIDAPDVIGWTRQGDSSHPNSGLATVITDGQAGTKTMNVGKNHAGETWYDMTGNRSDTVVISGDGSAEFGVNDHSISVYVMKGDVPRKPVTPVNDTPAPKATVAPKTPVPTEDVIGTTDSGTTTEDAVTIYYQTKSGFAKPYIYFHKAGTAWGTAQTLALNEADNEGYASISIPLGGASGIEAAFNDNNGHWDSRNMKNYTFSVGESTFNPGSGSSEGTIKSGSPSGNKATATPKVVVTPRPTPTPVAIIETPMPQPTEEVAVDPSPSDEEVEVSFTLAQVQQAIKAKKALLLNELNGRIVLPNDALQLVKRSGIELGIGNVSMTFTSELMTSILKAASKNKLQLESLSLQVTQTNPETKADLFEKARRMSNDAAQPSGDLYDFDLYLTTKSGDSYAISQFEKPLLVQVKLPAGANSNVIGFYHVDDEGNLEFVGGRVVGGVVSATLKHFSTYGSFEYYKNYDDIDDSNEASQAIRELAAKHIVTGVNDTQFAPNKAVTRAEFASILVRALGLEAAEPSTFTDVSKNAWYYDAVAAASGAGIVTGKGTNLFKPNAKITRQEMAAMVVRAYEGIAGMTVSTDAMVDYADVNKIQSWARGYVGAAQQLELFKGHGNRFDAAMSTTRAEASVAIYNLLALTNN